MASQKNLRRGEMMESTPHKKNLEELNRLSEKQLVAMIEMQQKILAAHKALEDLIPAIHDGVKASTDLSLYLSAILTPDDQPQ
jgi:hypothetical protein